MIKLLFVHGTNLTQQEWYTKLYTKYPWLKTSGLYKIKIVHITKVSTLKTKWDKVFIDSDSVKYTEYNQPILHLMTAPETAQSNTIWVTLNPKKKLSTHVSKPITIQPKEAKRKK